MMLSHKPKPVLLNGLSKFQLNASLKSMLIAASLMILSACGTIGQREIVSAKPAETPPELFYPTASLKPCPERLAAINLTESEWNALTPEAQVAALMRQGQSWVLDYFRCATRHNIGAEVYKESLERRQQWFAQRSQDGEAQEE